MVKDHAGDQSMSLEQFFSMGGYGFYVWSSYGLCSVVLIYNWLKPIRLRRQFLRQLALKQTRNKS